MSIPNESYKVENNGASIKFTIIDASISFLQKQEVASIDAVDNSVLINMSSGKTYRIWNYAKETEQGSTSAANLAEIIDGLVNA